MKLALRVLLGALFVFAGVMKLRDPGAFATEIGNYELLPQLAPWAAATLPMIEVVLGLVLLGAPAAWRRAAALSLSGLMLVFTAAVTQAVVRGINLDCGCFGYQSGPVSWLTIVRDVALLAAAVALVRLEK